MKWFKFYGQEYLSDPKMLTLSASERSCWITLLSYASVNDNENDNGMITFLSEQQLMTQAGIGIMSEEWNQVEGILKRLEKLKMITLDNEDDNTKITILNWQKRQETSLTGYERVKRYREKKQNDNAPDNVNDNAKITSDKKRIDKNRIEKNREDKTSDEVSTAVAVAENVEVNKNSEQYLNSLNDIGFVMELFRRAFGVSPKAVKNEKGQDLNAFAAKRLVKVHTRPKLKKMLQFTLLYQKTDKFCRICVNPLDFEKNYSWYKSYFERKNIEVDKKRITKITED